MKRRLCLILSVLLVGTFASAQARTQLSIMCNVAGAQVFLSGQVVGTTKPNLTISLRPGVYVVRVTKPGFVDFETRVSVGAKGASIRVDLQPGSQGARNAAPGGVNGNQNGPRGAVEGGSPAGDTNAPPPVATPAPMPAPAPLVLNYDLSITSNIDGADVYINGNAAGKTPFRAQVPAGSYTLQIRPAGYADYNQSIVVGNGPARVNANLQSLSYQVSVDANVRGALVFVNGQQVGQTPYAALLMPGSYTVLVRAPGFLDYQVPLNVNGPQSLNVSLQGATAPWQLRVPEGMQNKDSREGRGIQLWIDGALQATAHGQASGQLAAGRHVVRIAAGDLVSETQVDVQIGKSYVFEPFLGISVK
jgi:hypothetical protein